MTQFLYRRLEEKGWLQKDPTAIRPSSLGIVMRISQDVTTQFIAEPQTIDENLKIIADNMHLSVIFTMSSDITSLLFTRVAKDDTEISLTPNNITVPIVDSLEELASNSSGVRRRDFCCFIREQRIVLVWSTSADNIFVQAADVESKLMSSVRFLVPISQGAH